MSDRSGDEPDHAIAHFKRTGCILPGHQATIAGWLADR